MARPLRIDRAGVWYHVMNSGHLGGTLYRDDTDRLRFLGLVAKLPERFGHEIHAFTLMDNHYHLLLRTAVGARYFRDSSGALRSRRQAEW